MTEPADPLQPIRLVFEAAPSLAPDEAAPAPDPAAGEPPSHLRVIDGGDGEAPVPAAHEHSDIGLSDRFVAERGHDLRYVSVWSKWFAWDGQRWTAERTLKLYDQAKRVLRRIASRVDNLPLKKGLSSAKTVAAVEILSRSHRRCAAVIEQWDVDPMALGTPAGVVDLRTGAIRPVVREDYITKLTGAAPAPGPDYACPGWVAFLERVTGGDAALQDFLQRVAGYCLTGSTREHALFFLYGTGSNGKSVFLSTLQHVLGDYAATAPLEAFFAAEGERHPTDMAGLQGARAVIATEVDDGKRWAEGKLKAVTGGDKIAARFMRQDFFEYLPQFKLLIAGNHKPALRNVDESIRRRMHLVPFTVTIPAAERNEELGAALRQEAPVILAWAIEGAQHWQRLGLAPPPAVREATDAYLAAEDLLGTWITECCDVGRLRAAPVVDLFQSWKAWAARSGEHEGTLKRFVQGLEKRGMDRERNMAQRSMRGLALKPVAGAAGEQGQLSGEGGQRL